jgi:hypothetical protein
MDLVQRLNPIPVITQEVLKWPLFYQGRGDSYEYSPNPERAVDD